MCSHKTCLWCSSQSISFPSVSLYLYSDNPESLETFFLLPYGNKCHFFLCTVTHISFRCALLQISPPLCWITAVLKTASLHIQSSFACCKTLCLRSQASGHSEGWLCVKATVPQYPSKAGDGVAARLSLESRSLVRSMEMMPGWGHWPQDLTARPPRTRLSRCAHEMCSYSFMEVRAGYGLWNNRSK